MSRCSSQAVSAMVGKNTFGGMIGPCISSTRVIVTSPMATVFIWTPLRPYPRGGMSCPLRLGLEVLVVLAHLRAGHQHRALARGHPARGVTTPGSGRNPPSARCDTCEYVPDAPGRQPRRVPVRQP